jgi:hypothetical protein
MSTGKSVSIQAELFWSSLRERSAMSGKYQVDLCNLSDADVKALSTLGLKVNNKPNKPEQGNYITAKSNYEIVAYDAEGNEIDKDFRIANGSKAKVIVSAYSFPKPYVGFGASVKKLIVTKPIEYKNSIAELEEDVL